MTPATRRLVFWSPRLLSIGFATFLSLFAFDAFNSGQAFWPAILSFLIHLLPAIVVVLALVIAWRWEWTGTVSFSCAALFYAAWVLPAM